MDKLFWVILIIIWIVSALVKKQAKTSQGEPPTEEDLKTKLNSLFQSGKGVEIDYWIVMDRKKINLVREMEDY